MQRREFGRRILRTAAALGLRTVSAAPGSALGLLLSACAEQARDRQQDAATPNDAAPVTPLDAEVVELDAGVSPNDASVARPASVIIVGSGYGAAVTALRLTERGIAVTMLEMGRLWSQPAADNKVFCSLLAPDGRAMWFKDKTEAVVQHFGPFDAAFNVPNQAGVLDVLGPEDMRVFCGRGVGGGSLVNMSIYVTPVREVFERVFPSVDAEAMFSTYYPRAKQQLRASMVPESMISADCYQYSRVGIQGAESVGIKCERVESGYDYAYMQQEIDGKVARSALGGEAAFGNNHGKQSLDQTYLADAMGTGLLTIHAMHQLTRITPQPDGGYLLQVKEIDVDGKLVARKELSCSHLFLGAGSMGTSELLVSARERGDLPDLTSAVGTQWGPNSDIFVARDNPLWLPTGSLQASVPSSSFRTRDADGKHMFSMIVPIPVGIETWISLNIVMTESSEAGHFVYDAASEQSKLVWHAEQNQPAVASARFVFDAINLKTGSSYAKGMFAAGEIGDRATYHPVGGCPLGLATDPFGRLRNYPGLYVVDGSLIPIGIGANPALTVTALAERNIERVVAEDFVEARPRPREAG